MRVFSYMVTRNEADRYLRQSIQSAQEHTDGFFIYDDRSDDGTIELLQELKVQHFIRPPNDLSFVENEADFRNQAWQRMAKLLGTRDGDWIFTLDADEILRTNIPLREICEDLDQRGYVAAWMHVHEMWTEGQIRTDGYWGQIRAKRLGKYQPHGQFQTFEQHRFGGGSLPIIHGEVGTTETADILHYGYTKDRDKKMKYERYRNVPGHNHTHVESILGTPVLAPLPPLV